MTYKDRIQAITLTAKYARLEIFQDQPFTDVTESFRALLQVCRLNRLSAALVVSTQDAFDWRSSLRVAIRFSAARGPLPVVRLALVSYAAANAGVQEDVCAVASEAGLECRSFHREDRARGWLESG